ncbi:MULTISPECIES: UDP-glucose 4-epimerase GalE [unclassified Rhodococcus (in: high G+C Gram-positive bacteria)]|uniref:UDP-glucose 4-epimerase GalE n=1 Tax=Rhodococcus sp. SJ-3 TaxID=3454628 RepID=UPI003F7A725F
MLLVTGGAGYIGTHVVRALRSGGREVVVVDDLSAGHPELLPAGVPVEVGSVLDTDFLMDVIDMYDVDQVVHLAGRKAVDESITRPSYYYRQNVYGMQSVLAAMVRMDVRRIVFSSSAAVYGTVGDATVTEEAVTLPQSPYGRSKLMCEWLLRDIAAADGLSWAALRYFNVAGAGGKELADRGVHNLVPRVFQAIDRGEAPAVFGDTYDTPDGTCIRDYIHVTDLADAHATVVDAMDAEAMGTVYNVGCGCGASVLDVMRAAREASGVPFDWRIDDPRPGDPARVVADAGRIYADLGWTAQHDLDDIVGSAWEAWTASRAAIETASEQDAALAVGAR